jgi:hypothetical protein
MIQMRRKMKEERKGRKTKEIEELDLPSTIENAGEETREWRTTKMEDLRIPRYTALLSTRQPFAEWYRGEFAREITNRNIASRNLIILYLRAHVDKELWQPLTESWEDDEFGRDLGKLLKTLSRTYNVTPEEQSYREELKSLVQKPQKAVRVYEGRLREVGGKRIERGAPRRRIQNTSGYS